MERVGGGVCPGVRACGMAKQAVPIGEVLEKLLKKLGLERRAREARIAQEWGRVVGSGSPPTACPSPSGGRR